VAAESHHAPKKGPKPLAKPGGQIMSDASNLIGRILLSAVFIVYGYLAFSNVGGWLNFNQAALKRFFDLVAGGAAPPAWFGYLIAAIQLLGGIAILIGFNTRRIAYAFVVYLILVVFFAHNFWDMQGAARAGNMAHFYKNLAIMGGFLILALQGAGRYSLDARTSRR
jgi:putative oxidoreductase